MEKAKYGKDIQVRLHYTSKTVREVCNAGVLLHTWDILRKATKEYYSLVARKPGWVK
jgi:hypothetical protein